MRGVLAKSTILGGALITLSGGALVVLYLWEAVLRPWGDPDQSLLFWYLPLLMLGVTGASLGVVLMAWGRGRDSGS
jgi:hypothetical protein